MGSINFKSHRWQNIDNDDDSSPLPSISDAIKSLKIISDFAIFNDLNSAMEPISKLQNIFMFKRLGSMKQTTLFECFNKEK